MPGSVVVWNWLDSIDAARAAEAPRPAKRARHGASPDRRHLPPTPLASRSSSPGRPMSSKRPREPDDGVSPVDATPRPRKTAQLSRPSDDSLDVTSQSSWQSSSNVSRRSSLANQLRNAELQSTGFRRANLLANSARLPTSLASLVKDLTHIQNGEAILPRELASELAPLDLPSYAFGADDSPPLYAYPPHDLIDGLFYRAAECEVDNEGESSWNMDVHGKLLHWVLRDRPASGPLDYRYCPTARIVPHFRPHHAPGKMVDFCLAVRPAAHEQDVIDALCKSRPSLTINHTDWGNLSKHPIALSIETKRPGERLDEAILQIGTWHSSQWRGIRHGGRVTGPVDFLPGIIIHGHDWLFVATTVGEDLKATTYSSLHIGDTSSAFGIYKLLAALQRLTGWCESTYWPAFRAHVLDMPEA